MVLTSVLGNISAAEPYAEDIEQHGVVQAHICGNALINGLSVWCFTTGQFVPVSAGFTPTVSVSHDMPVAFIGGTSLCCDFATISNVSGIGVSISGPFLPYSGYTYYMIDGLVYGSDNIFIITIYCNGNSNTYTITIHRTHPPHYNDAGLAALSVYPGTLSPAFAPGISTYDMTVAHDVTSITVTVATNHLHATYEIDGYDDLQEGPNLVTVTVTAPNGTTESIYTIIVYRQSPPSQSSDASLYSLTITPGTLTPVFNPTVQAYTATVANSVTQVTVTAVANCSYATISGDGVRNLAVGANEIIITVTAEDGTERDYTIIVTRQPPPDGPPSNGNDSSSNGNDSSYTPPPPPDDEEDEDEDDNDNENDNENDDVPPEPEAFVFEIPEYSLSATFSGSALLNVLENYDYLTLVRNRFSASFSATEISKWEFDFDSQIILFLHSDVMNAVFADVLATDPLNEVILKEFIYVTVVIDGERIETYTIISVQIDDLNLTDAQLERLVGVWIDETTSEYIIIEGILSEDGQVFSFQAIASGVFGIMLAEKREPSQPTEPIVVNSLVFTADSPIFILNGAFFLAHEAPFIDPETDRMMVPLRNVTNSIGVDVDWDDAAHAVLILLPYETLTLEIGRPLSSGYGVPVIVNDRTFVPLRFVMETFGATVEWDAENQAADISWISR